MGRGIWGRNMAIGRLGEAPSPRPMGSRIGHRCIGGMCQASPSGRDRLSDWI